MSCKRLQACVTGKCLFWDIENDAQEVKCFEAQAPALQKLIFDAFHAVELLDGAPVRHGAGNDHPLYDVAGFLCPVNPVIVGVPEKDFGKLRWLFLCWHGILLGKNSETVGCFGVLPTLNTFKSAVRVRRRAAPAVLYFRSDYSNRFWSRLASTSQSKCSR